MSSIRWLLVFQIVCGTFRYSSPLSNNSWSSSTTRTPLPTHALHSCSPVFLSFSEPFVLMKFYAVAKGFHTGIFHTWQETKIEVEGYSGAVFKKFNNQKDAQGFLQKYSTTSPAINRTESKQKSPEKERPPPSANTKKRKAEPMPPNHSHETQKKPNRDVPKDLKIHIMFDGGSRGNPGVAGAGALVSVTNPVGSGDYNTYSLHCRYFVGDKETNNVAEYSGLLLGLRVAWREIENAHPSIDVPIDVLVQGDSELIVKQLKGIYKCRNQSLKTLFNQVMSILNQMRARYAGLKIDINHVYRSDNAVADGLANEAMDARRSWITTSADQHTKEHACMDISDLH